MSPRRVAGAAPRLVEGVRERHVLCVDDDAQFLKSLEFFLPEQINRPGGSQEIWYRFLFLDNPGEALEVLRQLVSDGREISLLVTDQMMPGMKGTDFLKAARDLSRESVRVLLTGHAGIESAIQAINEDLLDRYVTKPIENEEEFTLNIRQLLDQYEMRATIHEQAELIGELFEFSNHLNATQGLATILQTVAEFTRRVLRCRHAAISGGEDSWEESASTDPHGSTLRLPMGAENRRRILDDFGPSRAVASRGRETPFAQLGGPGDSMGPCAYGALVNGEDLLGVIVATEPLRGGFSEQDLRNLGHVCDTASVSLRNELNRMRLERAWADSRAQAARLVDANRRLRILDKLKSDFLSFISHELRTPLTFLSASSLLPKAKGTDEQGELVEIIQRGYRRLEHFIEKGLEYFGWMGVERVEDGASCDLGEVVRRVVHRLAAESSQARFELAVEGNVTAAMRPEDAEDMVFVLLHNAIKFSDSRARVTIEAQAALASVRLAVRDHGRGFPPEWAAEIFEPFTVVESMRHREGSALSLAKVAAMVRAHGGAIRAHSAGKGSGATFIVELPRPAAARRAAGDLESPAVEPPTRAA